MHEHVEWADLRREAIERFGGEVPGQALEAEIRDLVATLDSATTVRRQITDVAEDMALGKISSGWPILRRRLSLAAESAAKLRVSIGGDDREKRVLQAEQFIARVGCFLPTPQTFEQVLFGIPQSTGELDELLDYRACVADGSPLAALLDAVIDRTRAEGPTEPTPSPDRPLLAPWAGDAQLRGRMFELWLEHRPVGVAIEEAAEERARDYIKTADRLAELRRRHAEDHLARAIAAKQAEHVPA
jgi:hypothetical protein